MDIKEIDRYIAHELFPLLRECGVDQDKILHYPWKAPQVIDIVLNRVRYLENQLIHQTEELRKLTDYANTLKSVLKCE